MTDIILRACDFTDRRVYRRLAALLTALAACVAGGAITRVIIDRYSLDDDRGISAQQRRQARLRAGDDDVAAYMTIPDEAFDPANRALAAAHGVTFLRLGDIHPAADGTDVMGALVVRGSTLFARLTTSATKRQIRRFDGDDDNAYTTFLIALQDHLAGPSLQLMWTDDPRRAGRDAANWARILRKARERNNTLTFGERTYHPLEDKLLLQLLAGMAQQDDDTRRQMLGGGRIDKLLANACPIPEKQLPHGIRHRRRADGRVYNDKQLGHLPEWDTWWQAIAEAVLLVADEKPWVDIGRFFAAKRLPRRGQNVPPNSTFADLLDRPAALGEAAKNVFINDARNPRVEPELYFNKITLWESGNYLYRFKNDLAARDAKVGGLTPTYRNDDDVNGYFHFALDWREAPTADGQPVPDGLGHDADVWRKVRQRLLDEIGAPRYGRSSRPEQRADQRVFTSEVFGFWSTTPPDTDPDVLALYPGTEVVEWGTTSRQHNPRKGTGAQTPGKNTVLICHRDYAAGTAATGRRRGMLDFAGHARHRAGTFGLAELAASVADAQDAAVIAGLMPSGVATVDLLPAAVVHGGDDRRRRLEEKIAAAEMRAGEARADAARARKAAAKCADSDDDAGFAEYDQDRREASARADAESLAAAQLREVLTALPAETGNDGEAELLVNIALPAYLSAGLRRAAANNGRASAAFATRAARHYTRWRFTPRGAFIHWSCVWVLPLADGGDVELPLEGVIANIRDGWITDPDAGRTPQADVDARYLLAEGRALEWIAANTGRAATRATVLKKTIMPWLAVHGITSRGAKNALVDHPDRAVQRLIHAQCVGQDENLPADLAALPERWRAHAVATYTDALLQWGDAAVPDDVQPLHHLSLTLAQPHLLARGAGVDYLARYLGVSDKRVRRWVAPDPRAVGFTRPRYLEYTDGEKFAVRLIRCPHRNRRGRPCGGVCDIVVLLPEVATSGYGVLCSTCLRVPRTDGDWPDIVFPAAYRTRYNGHGGPTRRLRDSGQTVPAADRVLLDLPPACRAASASDRPVPAAVIRRWAAAHDIACAEHGRLPRALREMYAADANRR